MPEFIVSKNNYVIYTNNQRLNYVYRFKDLTLITNTNENNDGLFN